MRVRESVENAALLPLRMKEVAMSQAMQAAPEGGKQILYHNLQKEYCLADTLIQAL